MAKLKKKIDRKEARFGRQYHTPEPQRQRAGWEHPCCLDPPDRTLKLLDTAASPGTALRWRSPKTTYQLPHKMVNPGWSQGPWKGRMGKTKSLAIWKCRKLFLYQFYKKKKKKIQSFKPKLSLVTLSRFCCSWAGLQWSLHPLAWFSLQQGAWLDDWLRCMIALRFQSRARGNHSYCFITITLQPDELSNAFEILRNYLL